MELMSGSLELWCDADFIINWRAEIAHIDRTCQLSNHLVIQTETALSMTEAECIALSEGLRTIIPLLGLMDVMQAQGMSMMSSKAEIKCKVFQYNSGALDIVTLPND